MLNRNDLDNPRDRQYDVAMTEPAVFEWPAPVQYRFPVRKQPSRPPIPPYGGGGDRGESMGSEACDLVVANLSAYQDDELDADQHDIVEVHLRKCDHCASVYAAIQTTDMLLEREWHEIAPLPSSFEFTDSVDTVMAALPTAPTVAPRFEPRRVHSRTRWMRFATGAMGAFAFFGMLISSYALGFANGRRSLPGHPLSTTLPSLRLPFSTVGITAPHDDTPAPPLVRIQSVAQHPFAQHAFAKELELECPVEKQNGNWLEPIVSANPAATATSTY